LPDDFDPELRFDFAEDRPRPVDDEAEPPPAPDLPPDRGDEPFFLPERPLRWFDPFAMMIGPVCDECGRD